MTKDLGWLRAGVLGANDGVLTTAALVIGIASAGTHVSLLTVGLASTLAGALSMATGEYVSVQSQVDAEQALSPSGSSWVRPVQAASASALSFTAGSTAVLAAVLVAPPTKDLMIAGIGAWAVGVLGVLGGAAAVIGGDRKDAWRSSLRTMGCGMVALGVSVAVGLLFGA